MKFFTIRVALLIATADIIAALAHLYVKRYTPDWWAEFAIAILLFLTLFGIYRAYLISSGMVQLACTTFVASIVFAVAVQAISFTSYPGLAKDIDLVSVGNAIRTFWIVLIGTAGQALLFGIFRASA